MSQVEGISEELDDYVYIQRLNINRLNNRVQNNWSVRDLHRIKAVGQKEYPLAAYARGLLTQITGEILYPNIVLAGSNLDFRSDHNVSRETSKLSLSPNPVSDILTIEYSDSEVEIISYTLIDINGKHILRGIDKQLDLSAYDSGVYILQLRLSNGDMINSKISKN